MAKKDCYELPKIVLLACGGTIGGEWSPVHDTVVPSKAGNKRLMDYINNQVRPSRKIKFVDLFNKDSRAITNADRLKITNTVKQLRKQGYHHFLITHGTFTMVETGIYLEDKLKTAKINDVFIVLCGSMIPNTGFAPSDAQFNLGFAIGKLSSLSDTQSGIWITMNALLSRTSSIRKNVDKARFESKN